MSKYIEAPAEFDGQGKAIFFADGITDCPNPINVVHIVNHNCLIVSELLAILPIMVCSILLCLIR